MHLKLLATSLLSLYLHVDGQTCLNDPDFTFKTLSGKTKKCQWVVNKQKRKKKYCQGGKSSEAIDVYINCQATCRNCVVDTTDDSTFEFELVNQYGMGRGKMKNCLWLNHWDPVKAEKRQNHYCVKGGKGKAVAAFGCRATCKTFEGYVPYVQITNAPTKAPTTPGPTPTAPFPAPSRPPSPMPSPFPTLRPTSSPSDAPSMVPSTSPSDSPSKVPSDSPSMEPSTVPSDSPSLVPSGKGFVYDRMEIVTCIYCMISERR